jgi:hypothetical protein
VSTLPVSPQGRRLAVARQLPFAAALVEELQNLQVKVTEAANESFGSLGEGYHDDLVMAIMVAAWAAEHAPMGVGLCVRPLVTELNQTPPPRSEELSRRLAVRRS